MACKRFRGCDHDNEASAPGIRYRAMQLFFKWGGGGGGGDKIFSFIPVILGNYTETHAS